LSGLGKKKKKRKNPGGQYSSFNTSLFSIYTYNY